MTIEEIYALPVDGRGWRVLPSGNYVKLGNYVNLGDGVTLGNGVKFEKNPLAVQGTKHLAVNVAPGVIQIGCQAHSFAHWQEHVLGIARQHGYTAEQGLEYERIVAFLIANGLQPKGVR